MDMNPTQNQQQSVDLLNSEAERDEAIRLQAARDEEKKAADEQALDAKAVVDKKLEQQEDLAVEKSLDHAMVADEQRVDVEHLDEQTRTDEKRLDETRQLTELDEEKDVYEEKALDKSAPQQENLAVDQSRGDAALQMQDDDVKRLNEETRLEKVRAQNARYKEILALNEKRRLENLEQKKLNEEKRRNERSEKEGKEKDLVHESPKQPDVIKPDAPSKALEQPSNAGNGQPNSFADARSQSGAAASVASDRQRRNEKYMQEQKDFDRRIDSSHSPLDKERLTHERDLQKHTHLSEQKSWLLGQGSSAIGENKELRDMLKTEIAEHNKEASQLRQKLEPQNYAYQRTETAIAEKRLENADRGVSSVPQQTKDRVAERSEMLQQVREKTQVIEQKRSPFAGLDRGRIKDDPKQYEEQYQKHEQELQEKEAKKKSPFAGLERGKNHDQSQDQKLENAARSVSAVPQQTRDRVDERSEMLQQVREKTQEKEQTKSADSGLEHGRTDLDQSQEHQQQPHQLERKQEQELVR